MYQIWCSLCLGHCKQILSWSRRGSLKSCEKYTQVLEKKLRYFLIYDGSDLKLKGYTDSSFQSDPDDSKLISEYVFTLYGGAVSWKNFKQQTIADSITETEYIATSEATKEAIWIKKFIIKFGCGFRDWTTCVPLLW